jgi:hypothetical protein
MKQEFQHFRTGEQVKRYSREEGCPGPLTQVATDYNLSHTHRGCLARLGLAVAGG